MLRRALVFALVTAAQAQPPYPSHHAHGCEPPNDALPFCDVALPTEDRVADLISRLSLSEKFGMTADQTAGASVAPSINWNVEGLHGLGAQYFSLNATSAARAPTIFAAPPALASSFNRTLLRAIGDAISTEARAYNNNGGNRGYQGRPVDLNVWLPNINLARDPRWGRQVETYSEDPWLTGQLGAEIVRGAQRGFDGGAAGGGYLKIIVAVKHATGYQIETDRFNVNENISAHDLADSYYPAWEGVVEEGGAAGFMCAYPRINGVPMCGNPIFETTLMKETWGLGSQTGGGSYVQSDCGAVDLMVSYGYAKNLTYAAAVALNAGTDVDCWGTTMPGQLGLAIEMGLTTEAQLDASLTRTFTLQFLAGRFDPLEAQPYTRIPFEAIGSAANHALAAESVAQGMVLLRNDAALLPLAPGARRLALVGPFANYTAIAGNYYEDICPSGPHGDAGCVPTLLAAIAVADGKAPAYAPGCDVSTPDPSGIAAAAAACAASDVCLLALGDNTAGEGNDKTDTSLPGEQGALAAAVLACGKPTVLVLFNGATLAIDAIVAAARPAPLAIVVAWMPGVAGGTPVAAALFGATNAWGKLPVSWYPQEYFNLLPIQDMDMVHGGGGAGRTYKYYNRSAVAARTNTSGELLWPLGFGLSYTTFVLNGSCPNNPPTLRLPAAFAPVRGAAASAAAPAVISCTVTVTNTGARDGDEVVAVFLVPNATAVEAARRALLRGGPRRDPLASRLLVAFDRVHVPAGGRVDVPFNFSVPSFATVDDDGARVVRPGAYVLRFSTGASAGGDGDVEVPVVIEVDGGERTVLRRYPVWW